jgi:HSP20 family molecular chaperone IbpA
MQDNFKMAVDVPGVESDKLNIEAEGNVLRIRRAFAHVCDAFCASLRIFAYR